MDRLLSRGDIKLLAESDLLYLDSAATSLTPHRVVEAMSKYYGTVGAAAGRGIYRAAARATAAVEDARGVGASFFNCQSEEIVFTHNATDGINLVAYGLHWQPGDRILTTVLEHHANLLPWVRLVREAGVEMTVIQPDSRGEIAAESFDAPLAAGGVKLVAVTARSNVTGMDPPVAEITSRAHAAGAMVLIDAAQAVPHVPFDLGVMQPDFFVMSGHKALGPKGSGILFVRREIQEQLAPARLGGGMVEDVSLESYRLCAAPERYEAGTYDVPAIIGLAEALTILMELKMDEVARHDRDLGQHLYEGLRAIPRVEVLGPHREADVPATCTFVLADLKPHRAASLYDNLAGICVRSGHHCALPLIKYYGHPEGTVRASAYVYNDGADIDRFLEVTADLVKGKLK